MIDHDRLFKELLTTFFVEFLELFYPQVLAYLDRDSIEFLDKELFTDVSRGETHLVDVVVKARYRGSAACFLIHVENQAKAQTYFGRRMFGYCGRLMDTYDLDVYPIAIFSFDEPKRPEPDSYRMEFPDLTVIDFRFRVIQLNRLSWRDFVNRPNPVASALMAKMKIAKADRPKVKLECLRLLATLQLNPAKMRLISGFVDTYLSLNRREQQVFEQELETLPQEERTETLEIVTSWMREGIKQGRKEGRKEGRQEGREEGRQEGVHKAVLLFVQRLAAGKIGTVDAELVERFESLTTEQLQDLGVALLRFESRSEVIAYLDALPK